MATRDYGSDGAANALQALTDTGNSLYPQHKPFDFNVLVDTIDKIKKMRNDQEKSDREAADLDALTYYRTGGRVIRDPQTGKLGFQLPQPGAVAPITQAAGAGAYQAMLAQGGGQQAPTLQLPPDPNDPMAAVQAQLANLTPQQAAIAKRQIAVNAARNAQETKVLEPNQVNAISDYANAIDQMESMLQEQSAGKYKTGPVLAGGKYGFSDLPLAASIRGGAFGVKPFTPDESAFFSNARSTTSDFLKAATGAQRGMKEVQFLLPAVPEPGQHIPEQFQAVGKAAISRARNHLNRILDFAERSGYKNVDQLRAAAGRSFEDEAAAEEAVKSGRVRPGDTIYIAGQKAKVKG